MYALGLVWKPSSLEYLHTSSTDTELHMSVSFGCHESAFRLVEQMELLGTLLSVKRLQNAPIDHRLQKANACFRSHKDFFLCKQVPLAARLKE